MSCPLDFVNLAGIEFATTEQQESHPEVNELQEDQSKKVDLNKTKRALDSTDVECQPNPKRQRINDPLNFKLQEYTFSAHDEELKKIALASILRTQKLQPNLKSFRDHAVSELQPHVELVRRQCIKELTKELHNACLREGLDREPPSIVVRWLFVEMLTSAETSDLLVPYTTQLNHVLQYELSLERRFNGQKLQLDTIDNICRELNNHARRLVDTELKEAKSYIPAQKHGSTLSSPPVTRQRSRAKEQFEYDDHRFALNPKHYEKLKSRFIGNPQELDRQVFLLLCRYDALGGPGYQAAIPPSLFEFLQNRLGVSHECFASPLNCTLQSYGSAFYDTDHYFGSKGSFFEMEDSFFSDLSCEANPPFVEATMLAMSLRIEYLLRLTDTPLSFTIFVPGWNDTPSFYMMRDSIFNRLPNQFLHFKKDAHSYQDGYQHRSDVAIRTSQADSFVFILQNDAGAKKWCIDPDVIHSISSKFYVGAILSVIVRYKGSVPDMRQARVVLDLMTKASGCQLCNRSKAVLLNAAKKMDIKLEIREVDIESPQNQRLFELYKYDIPVGLIKGQEVFRHRLDLEQGCEILRNHIEMDE